MAAISSSVSGAVADDALQVGKIVAPLHREGDRRLPALHCPLEADDRRMKPMPLAISTITGSSMLTVSSAVRSRSGRPGDPIGL